MQLIIKEKYTFPEHFKSENYYAIFLTCPKQKNFHVWQILCIRRMSQAWQCHTLDLYILHYNIKICLYFWSDKEA